MKKLLCICLIAVMLAAFTVCNGTSDESSGKKVVLNVHMNGDSVTIDPAFAYDNASSLVVDQITESLPTHNPYNAIKPTSANPLKPPILTPMFTRSGTMSPSPMVRP